ncbi:MFS transporter [Caldivirga maquilingensis]|uniref:Major facilitator superfamily MFS_1 n=1 Tax=Caldivirga maquilingensis (strain ATCC 700844 / DSM 13496 / JCM 10307 / IC-167) TaxID=397948 RepID=A8M8X2_CALMQ|nr:MFS transporter [Caldivirga maquilingensis]ABW02191.1 major facilitator superfamily MFS_1 [Caldivirga maquilingensis IC-167]
MGIRSILLVLSVLVPFLMSAFCIFSVVYLFPEISLSIHVTVTALTLMVTLSFIGGAIGGVVFGMIADAYGRRIGLMTSVILFSLMTLLAGFARTLWEFYVAWFLVGFGVNPENGITYAVIAENWRGGRGLIGGLTQGLYFIGIMLDALVYSIIHEWNLVLIVTGAVSLLSSLPWLIIMPETVSRVGLRRINYSEVLKDRFMWLTILGIVIVASAFMLTVPLVSLAPTYLKQIGISNLNLWLLVLPVIGALAYTLAGYLSDLYGRVRVLVALSIIALASSVALLVTADLGLLDYMIPSIALTYVSSSVFSYLGVLMSELYPVNIRATASNLVFTLGRVLGGIGPPLIAFTFASNLGLGLGVVMLISAFLSLVSAVILGIKFSLR